MKLNDMTINPARLEQGAWVDNIPEMGDLRLKVRGLGNADHRNLQQKLFDAEPRQNKVGGRLNADSQDAISARCILDTILIDWDKLEGEDGYIPYSREVAEKLLTDPAFRRFREAVTWAASVVVETTDGARDDAAGNSALPSSGN